MLGDRQRHFRWIASADSDAPKLLTPLDSIGRGFGGFVHLADPAQNPSTSQNRVRAAARFSRTVTLS